MFSLYVTILRPVASLGCNQGDIVASSRFARGLLDAANADARGALLAASGEGSIASTVRVSYERWGAGGAATVYCARWRGDTPMPQTPKEVRSGDALIGGKYSSRSSPSSDRYAQRTGLDGNPLTKPAVSGRDASNYYRRSETRLAPGSESTGSSVEGSKLVAYEDSGVIKSMGSSNRLRRNVTGGFFSVGDSASKSARTPDTHFGFKYIPQVYDNMTRSHLDIVCAFRVIRCSGGMHTGRLTRRVQDWALGPNWPASARLVFDPALRTRPGAGATVRQLRELFTAECNLEVPCGAAWFSEGIVDAGMVAIARLSRTSTLKYEEYDNATEQIVTRFCCTIPN